MTGVKRDCACPRAKHQHGTITAYASDACRCDRCRAAVTRAQKLRRLLIQRGQWCAYEDVTGTRRRLHALALNGWALTVVCARIGIEPSNLRLTLRSRSKIAHRTADAVRRVYDEWWDVQAPTGTQHERISAARARTWARNNGALPALAWDDEDHIDDPAAVPQHDLRGGPWELQPCGTHAAARRHHRHGEKLCDACSNAERRRNTERAA